MRAKSFDEVQATGRFELDVREHDVGLCQHHGVEGFLCIFRLAAYGEIHFALDGFHEAAAHQWMVFNYEHFDFHASEVGSPGALAAAQDTASTSAERTV